MEKEEFRKSNIEEIESVINSGTVREIEDKKTIGIAYTIIWLLLSSFVMLLIWQERNRTVKEMFNPICWTLIAIGAPTIIYTYRKKDSINRKYKEAVMPVIIENIFGKCNYELNKFIDKELYYESRLFEIKERTTYCGSEFIEYETYKIVTTVSRLKVNFFRGYGKNRTRHTQFIGEYFINEYKNSFEDGEVIIKFNKIFLKKELLSLKSILIFILATPLFILFITEFKKDFFIIAIMIFILIKLKNYEAIPIIGKLIKQEEKSGKEFSNFFLVEGNDSLAEKILNQDVREMLIELKKMMELKQIFQ